MTLDEAFQTAAQLLIQRGQLLNGHLLRLVEGDKELFREVRERLIQQGIAEDRAGVGLAVVDTEDVPEAQVFESGLDSGFGSGDSGEGSSAAQTPETDWWLMKKGVAAGPMELHELCELCRKGEVDVADVVRHGASGLWISVDSIPEFAAARRGLDSRAAAVIRKRQHQAASRQVADQGPSATKSTSGVYPVAPVILPDEVIGGGDGRKRNPDETTPATKERFLLPERDWSIAKHPRFGMFRRAANSVVHLAGGPRQFTAILLVCALCGAVYYWWQLPPSNADIQQEFTSCAKAIRKLRERRSGRNDWSEMQAYYQPRIQAIAARLKPYSSDRYPIQKSLYLAATQGLLPMIEYNADYTRLDLAFDKHMEDAQKGLAR